MEILLSNIYVFGNQNFILQNLSYVLTSIKMIGIIIFVIYICAANNQRKQVTLYAFLIR